VIDKLASLKPNKILFWVLIPLVIVAFVLKLLMDGIVKDAKKDIKETQLKDIDLEKEQKEIEAKAEEIFKESKTHKEVAENHEANAENAEVDEDWHKKK